ncbi:phosphatase PAP2 family protein [Sungkyunkwania multivorans]|uniref:Phosphatase PAP2 family protein n=1 Tax=Sungkyunkwania multivorans TaxID=1173618 RepID=A0ABW3CYI7_9FLAO
MKKVFWLFIVGVNLSFAQTSNPSSESTIWQSFKYDAGNIVRGIGHAYSRPFQWKGDQWKTFGMVTAANGFVYLFDEQTSDFFRDQKKDIPQDLLNYGWYYGNPQNNYMLTTGVYLTGLFTKNTKLRRTGVLMISSATAAGVLQQFSKFAFGRARPKSGRSKNTFDPWSSDKNFHSFPSGHAVMAFTNAYAIAKQFKNPWVKAGIYTVGLIPPATRLWEGAHWLSDITFGVVIAIFTVEAIDKYLDARYDEKYNAQSKKMRWDLQFAPGQLGVVVRF